MLQLPTSRIQCYQFNQSLFGPLCSEEELTLHITVTINSCIHSFGSVIIVSSNVVLIHITESQASSICVRILELSNILMQQQQLTTYYYGVYYQKGFPTLESTWKSQKDGKFTLLFRIMLVGDKQLSHCVYSPIHENVLLNNH